MKSPGTVACVITCAGTSSRMGGGVKKEYRLVDGVTVLEKSVRAFLSSGDFAYIVITVPSGGETEARAALSRETLSYPGLSFAEGGPTRRESVLNGLKSLVRVKPDIVLVHDAARPFVTPELVKAVTDAALEFGAAAPLVGVVDTVKAIDGNGFIASHPSRASLGAIQTPQGFRFAELLAAHEKAEELHAREAAPDFTDDTEIWDRFAGKTRVVPGSRDNRKITFPEDLP